MSWQDISTAPKDKLILLDVGYPWGVVGCYNHYGEEWVYSAMGCEQHAEGNEFYFENEYSGRPKGWHELTKF